VHVQAATEPNGAEVATLLVVDDDEHVRRALRRVLKRSRCRLLEAADAAAGIALLEDERVQVVVSDYRMPGMSGVEFLRVVKERWPRVQRVLLTGQADTAAIEEAVNQSEIFRFIWKPWDDAHLLLTIQSAVDQYWLSEENDRLHELLTQRNSDLERLNRDLDQKLEARSRALLRAADEWRACFDAIGDPLAVVRDGSEVVRANAAFARAANVPIARLPGARAEDGRFGELPCLPQLDDGEAREQAEVVGEKTWLVRSFPFGDGASVLVYKDVTEEREVQRRLVQAEKMAAVGQLAGGVAHEINNPLGGILAFAQIMSRDEGRSAEDVDNLTLISDAAVRAKRIVESLLRFSRRPKGDEQGAVNLAKVAEDALFLLQPELKSGRIALERRLEPAIAHGNANLLQQIAVNLLVNAFQAIGKGQTGKVTVVTGPGPAGHARLTVLDDGPGIPAQVASRIFEPFFTTKPEGQGTGLGLSICYRIAEEHGGSIHHEPAPGGGAAFIVDVPSAPRGTKS
jgi:two-component system NtrC family sensor kinase